MDYVAHFSLCICLVSRLYASLSPASALYFAVTHFPIAPSSRRNYKPIHHTRLLTAGHHKCKDKFTFGFWHVLQQAQPFTFFRRWRGACFTSSRRWGFLQSPTCPRSVHLHSARSDRALPLISRGMQTLVTLCFTTRAWNATTLPLLLLRPSAPPPLQFRPPSRHFWVHTVERQCPLGLFLHQSKDTECRPSPPPP